MSTRIYLTVVNLTGNPITCTNISCGSFDNMTAAVAATPTSPAVQGTGIAAGTATIFTTSTADRIYCTFTNNNSAGDYWQLCMTCPTGSGNNACGINPASGLQPYIVSTGSTSQPVYLTFLLGMSSIVGWNGSPPGDTSNITTYGECSGHLVED